MSKHEAVVPLKRVSLTLLRLFLFSKQRNICLVFYFQVKKSVINRNIMKNSIEKEEIFADKGYKTSVSKTESLFRGNSAFIYFLNT